MEQGIALLPAHLSVCIAEDESDGCKEVALPRTIAPNDDIMLGRKRLNDCLLLVTVLVSVWTAIELGAFTTLPLESLNDDLFDVHLVNLRESL